MDSSRDNGSEDIDESMDWGIEETPSIISDLEELENTCHDEGHTEDANATLEWSQFLSSTEGMLRYMEEATATIQDVPSLVVPSPGQESIAQDSTAVEFADQEQGCSSPGALFSTSRNSIQFEPMALPAEVLPRLSFADTMNLAVTTETSSDASLTDQLGSTMAGLSVPHDRVRSESSVPDRPGSMECRASVGNQADINESGRRGFPAGIPTQKVLDAEPSPPPSSSGSPGRHVGLGLTPDKTISAEPPSTPVSSTGLLNSTPSSQSLTGDADMETTPLHLVDEGEITILKAISSEPRLPWTSRVFETSRISTSQVALSDHQVKSEFACFEGGISVIAGVFPQIDVMASVGEIEVARRIGREKARCVKARQQQRKDSITK